MYSILVFRTKDMHKIFILLLQFLMQTSMGYCMARTLCDLQAWNYVRSILHFDRNGRSWIFLLGLLYKNNQTEKFRFRVVYVSISWDLCFYKLEFSIWEPGIGLIGCKSAHFLVLFNNRTLQSCYVSTNAPLAERMGLPPLDRNVHKCI